MPSDDTGGRTHDDGRPDALYARFAAAARAERPDLALLCLLVEAVALRERNRAATARGTGPTDVEPTEVELTEVELTETGPADAGPGGGGADDVVDRAQVELDRLTGTLPYAAHRTPAQWARALSRLLGDQEGFHGAPADYERLDSSLLGAVLRRRRGLPILLSVVWMEVARRAGAPVHGVALPGHFVVGFGQPGGPDQVLADPFAGGAVLSGEEVDALVARATGGPPAPSVMRPADPLAIVRRVLDNIRVWAAARPERAPVRLWAVELSLLLPHHSAHLRQERARLLVERGDFLAGAGALEEYAELVAGVEPRVADDARREARAARARLN
ncbi:transglutaminase-like domain-containing protein [Streptomyces sp. TRM 70351]|uniref:transglutaminase-like domain-containing protein n=1 Tax=Streptomyces sp. TRM 70351 TaxID=3116552 RepID=UPI002E7B4D01|nr:transglutaminase-like domain-containing protein [Streptomyces sp. TRM 70351]MEE1927735.1 transglutaminase-like domain-containing protein [Streptomyces sp. TRM 70351]